MNHERAKVDHDVHVWYADKARWVPQGKTAGWPDRMLLDQGKLIDGRDVLNLGCFYPEDEIELAHRARSWVAIDFVPEVIDACRALRNGDVPGDPLWSPGLVFFVADMRELPFENESFDVVTDFSSGDHLLREDWHRVISEAHRVLRLDGLFLVCYANRTAFEALGPYWKEGGDRFGDYGYVRTDTPAAMASMLEERGFTVIRRSHEADLRAGMLAVKR